MSSIAISPSKLLPLTPLNLIPSAVGLIETVASVHGATDEAVCCPVFDHPVVTHVPLIFL